MTAFVARKFSLKTVLMLGEQMINCIDAWSVLTLRRHRDFLKSARFSGRAALQGVCSLAQDLTSGCWEAVQVWYPCMRRKTCTFPDQVEDIKPSNFVVGAGDGQNDKALTSDYVQGSCQLAT